MKAAPHLQQSSVKYSSIGESALMGTGLIQSREDATEEIEDDIVDEVGESSAIDESIKESLAQSSHSRMSADQNKLADLRKVIGSEQAIINQGKEVLGQSPSAKGKGPFQKNSFQEYTSSKYKSMMMSDEQGVMAQYISQIEDAVLKKEEKERAIIQKQFDTKKISPRTYRSKKADLERWLSRERQEL